MDLTRNELIILTMILILIFVYTKYSSEIALKTAVGLLVVYGILYMCNVTSVEEYYNYNVLPIEMNDNSEYNESTCYMNGNRPFVIDSRGRSDFDGSTARCVIAGSPLSWKQPVWELPISDPRNPAFYNQFPSEAAHYKKM